LSIKNFLAALIASIAPPTPDEMNKDIQDLAAWRSAAKSDTRSR
jgi:hypothetical protein